jgi:4-hydroxymandelate oxidase
MDRVTDAVLQDAPSVAGFRAKAQARLDPAAWSYLESGCGDDLTVQANRRAFDRCTLMPRALADVRGGHTRLSLFGAQFAHPLLLAPIAYQRLFHADGETASAMAAAAQDGLMIVSSLASQPLESIVAAAEGRAWFQLYWQQTRERTLRLAQLARDAGCAAIVFTVDAPVKQAALQLPAGVSAVNLETVLDAPAAPAGRSAVFDGWMASAPTWDDLAWLRERLQMPLLVKGVLHADDAARLMALGCDGLIVSNHGGRVLDGAPASLDALPAIRARVGENVPVLLDSGIRSGRDAFKALAQGADAVLVGRPCIWGLAANGALGVAQVIRLLRDELELTMALTGCRTLGDIAPATVGRPIDAAQTRTILITNNAGIQ